MWQLSLGVCESSGFNLAIAAVKCHVATLVGVLRQVATPLCGDENIFSYLLFKFDFQRAS